MKKKLKKVLPPTTIALCASLFFRASSLTFISESPG